jgi:arsenite-transporting ATPase
MAPCFLAQEDFDLLLFAGKGGVGKTTCATATALKLAAQAPNSSFLLVSTDPAHSLSDILAGFTPPGNLKVLEFDAWESLQSFKTQHARTLREIAHRGTFLEDEDLNRFLDLSLPGLDELMAFLEISSWVQAGLYRCVVVDTAPCGHTLRLLAMPDLIRKWIGALDALLAKHRYLKKVFGRSSRPDELDSFLQELTGSVARMEELLQSPTHCRLVPVMLAEELSIRETMDLLAEVKRLQLPTTDIVANRLIPDNQCPVCQEGRRKQFDALQNLFADPELPPCSIWSVPLYAEEVRGKTALESFWGDCTSLSWPLPAISKCSPPSSTPVVESGLERPPAETTILLFGGKGGVGKTTLACATALDLVTCRPDRTVLLISTDPAHSLSDCLDLAIGSQPTPICSNLAAMEIDAAAEFRVLQQDYAIDLERLLSSFSNKVDPVFDRQVMERILDLAPPGVDELMALSQVMELLNNRSYDLFVLDCSATGHLMRLLELPALLDSWLKAFFEVFIKYREVIQLPGFSDRLVEISRNLKVLRTLLRKADQTALYAVSIPTQMALSETRRLIASCERLRISVPVFFLNLVTPNTSCALCSAVYQRELAVREEFRQSFPEKPFGIVYKQADLRGIEQLRELARALYHPAGKESSTYVC